MKRIHFRNLIFLAFTLLFSQLSIAQGTIKVTVADKKNGEPLTGANIMVSDFKIKSTTIGISDENGKLIFNNLKPGNYKVSASYFDHQTVTTSNIKVSKVSTSEIYFNLAYESDGNGTVKITNDKSSIDNIDKETVSNSEENSTTGVQSSSDQKQLTKVTKLDEPAVHGNAQVQYEKGIYYMEHSGKNWKFDYEKAAYWLTLAAEQGHVDAQERLGNLYDRNDPSFGVASYAPVDFKKAAYWYKKAAEQGNQWAQNDLGYLYYTGQGVKQDFNRAAELFLVVSKQKTRAAKEAMGNLGTLYLNGKGVKQNFDSAAYWYTKAAKVGNIEAQAKIGYLYLKGLGVPLDKKKGYDWLKLASRNHNEYAQLDLALLTATGQGTTKNPDWALHLLKVLSETSTDEIVKQRAKIYAQDIRQSNPNASATNPWEVFSKSNHQNHKESLSAGEVLLGLVLLNAALDDGKSNANHDPWDDIKRQQEESQRNVWRIQEEINIWCPPGPIGGR